ncbi:hydroxypyruvate reductase [Oscillochloris trichoides DG-6]|uniref:Hydroxypyruvate reductase n=1 Tax=Oscillochloris trichoides DG-6 TaxID=765420 RepID=E1IEQ0_9CHLR|nr:glycerate kinase [Oscillochloris trichoides]EFO80342.1 hydroxypyruvate reductase [Oscillochloris trichoides DG-6]
MMNHADVAATLIAAALAAVEPGAAVRAGLQLQAEQLRVGTQHYNLTQIGRIWVVAVGKAAHPMAAAAAAVLGQRLHAGVIVAPQVADPIAGMCVLAAGHPIPNAASVAAAQQVAALLAQTGSNDLVLVLISGGGSALLSLPVPGVALADLQTLTTQLLACGAPIQAINCLRKHLDQIKGGGMARMAAPAHVAALILSDVVGNPLDVIASGPTVPDPTTFADAWAVVERYGLQATLPSTIREHLQRGLVGQVADTPGPDHPCFAHTTTLLVGSNLQAAQAAQHAAQVAGFHSLILTTHLQGEARDVGRFLAAIGRELAQGQHPLPRPACLIVGGETTVTLRGAGRGGRNQELALAAVRDLADLPNIALVTLATDGVDGPTDAAGAVVTGTTLQRAQALGLDPSDYLARNDAYTFFAALGDLIHTGPTQTNVNDLAFVFAW